MNPTVLCIGGANLDRKLKLSEPLRMGTSNPVSCRVSSGGVARNVAENLARLDCRVLLLSVFSDDPDGNWLLDQLESLGIDASASLKVPGKRSGTYTAVENPDGEMLLAMADMQLAEALAPEHVERAWRSMATPDAVFLDTNFPEPVLSWIIGLCRAEEIVLHVDPVSVAKSRKLPDALEGIDTLQPNLDELESLAGKKLPATGERLEACRGLLKRGVRKVVLSHGTGGLHFVGSESQFSLPAVPAKARDVTGAGDALCAGVLWGRLNGCSDRVSSRAGLMMAAKTIECDAGVWPGLCPEFLEPLLNTGGKPKNGS